MLSDNVGRDLITVRIGPVVPDACPEDTPLGLIGQDGRIPGVPVAVQLVHAARFGGTEADRSSILVKLFVPIARGV